MNQTVLMDACIALAAGFLLTALEGPFVIPALRRLKAGQSIREDGPQHHQVKAGTPTMGGIMILAGILVSWLVFLHKEPLIGKGMVLPFGFGVIGFIDDYLKVVKKKSDGASLAQTAEYIEGLKKYVCHWFVVDDLDYLKKGGRITPAAAAFGTLLRKIGRAHV